MFITVCLISLLIPIGLSSAGSRTELTISECAARGGECDESKGRPVCGTDNQTYPTRCHLIRAQCSGHQVSLKHRGSCKECLESRSYAIAHQSSTQNKFVPRCRSDGSYAAVQCMLGAGCWCSDGQGKPIPNTTTRNGKPNCSKKSKTNIRRSPLRNVNQRNKRGCTRADQGQFNTNLIKVFHTEHNRFLAQNKHLSPGTSVTDKIVLDWKFTILDTNENHLLDKIEYRELKRLVKKVVKPKRCARAFGKFCDIDHDERLSRQEWSNCLSKDGINYEENQTHGVSNGGDSGANLSTDSHFDDYDDVEYEDESDEYNGGGIISHKYGNSLRPRPYNSPGTPYTPVYLLRSKAIKDPDPVVRETESDSDCLADRAVALDDQKNGAQALYVPECTADGRYQRVQCYRSAGYCWCVHEDTGKNIPGTSIKDGRPDCANNSSRPMKGCPEPKKLEFLKELKDFLRSQINSNANSGANATKWASEDEKVATLSFVLLDKNKNKVWERKEWKTFRDLVTAARALRKCGKKMPRYCDVNNDKKITLSEWLNCLNAHGSAKEATKTSTNEIKPTSQTSKLKGPNPLESYLKSD
ncbi:SPARC-related modular calcium-binding protein 1 isoform X2 [Bradysia coprophila]|uniref:SPARC-related modular calcium-binding protein 1 isoform X2 n=1 Tax=Bradysia coprophila TaxID=38358 RepID=UPI00187D9825|nr:SPARC-related modular calcium-binding protein 1 isoform X2 [Bradysia coprophila]XP_037034679.1 SPARC-related modular calcium-binding protein 1 isoform X2 [Bradysia coprophila]XP_037034680.1 SPARC-related modular calcium-binding protein 1 isoform X2 [Bradysia coprophila]